MRPPVPRLGSHKPQATSSLFATLSRVFKAQNVLRYTRGYKPLTPCLVQGCEYRGSFECRVSMRKVLVTPCKLARLLGERGWKDKTLTGYTSMSLWSILKISCEDPLSTLYYQSNTTISRERTRSKNKLNSLAPIELAGIYSRHLIPKALKHPGNRKHTQWPHRISFRAPMEEWMQVPKIE